jgi:hypothetical protein
VNAVVKRIEVLLPIVTPGGLNAREHWAVRSRRVKRERQTAHLICPRHPLPCVVTLTRIGTHVLDDDNLAGVLKSVRDGVADRLAVNDGNVGQVRFVYRQEKCKRRCDRGVRIRLEAMT